MYFSSIAFYFIFIHYQAPKTISVAMEGLSKHEPRIPPVVCDLALLFAGTISMTEEGRSISRPVRGVRNRERERESERVTERERDVQTEKPEV